MRKHTWSENPADAHGVYQTEESGIPLPRTVASKLDADSRFDSSRNAPRVVDGDLSDLATLKRLTSVLADLGLINDLTNIGSDSPLIAQSGGTPSIAVGAGAGTGATVSLATGSTDLCGRIILSAGTGTTAATVCTMTFSADLDDALYVVLLYPGNANAAPQFVYTVVNSASSWDIRAQTAISVSVQHQWHYAVVLYDAFLPS